MDDVEGSAAIAVAEVVVAGAWSQNGAIKTIESEILSSQQFLLQQQLEDLFQELLTSFGVWISMSSCPNFFDGLVAHCYPTHYLSMDQDSSASRCSGGLNYV